MPTLAELAALTSEQLDAELSPALRSVLSRSHTETREPFGKFASFIAPTK